jgi:outer membrane protein OmpA-like peptidoglycan-associated protein
LSVEYYFLLSQHGTDPGVCYFIQAETLTLPQSRHFRKIILFALCALPLSSCTTMKTHGSAAHPAAVASRTVGGDVQVYSLDGPAAGYSAGFTAKTSPMKGSAQGGIVSSHDSSVTVYPLDGEMMQPSAPVAFTGQPESLTPIPPYPPRDHMDAQGVEPSRIYFAHSAVKLDGSAKQVIKTVAQRAGTGAIQVEGHASTRTATTNPVESRIVNLKVSMERAFDVTRELIRDGVPAETIQTRAWGDTRPALPVDGKSTEDASRRVEIYVSPIAASYPAQ